MADSTDIKKYIETWYREQLQKKNPNCVVLQEKVKLKWGGFFECDAVVKSGNKIKEIHCLSISEYKTFSKNYGSGKLNKIRADALMLLGINCQKKVLAFTGKTMYDKINNDCKVGRFPNDIDILYIDLNKNKKLLKLISNIVNNSIKELK